MGIRVHMHGTHCKGKTQEQDLLIAQVRIILNEFCRDTPQYHQFQHFQDLMQQMFKYSNGTSRTGKATHMWFVRSRSQNLILGQVLRFPFLQVNEIPHLFL